MPTNGEKRPRWLMICKCGATVKASRSTAEIDGFSDRSPPAGAPEHRFVEVSPDAARPPQGLGTIEARSKVEVSASWKACPSRWNSIRRSKALDRMMGNRVMTCSRTARKSDFGMGYPPGAPLLFSLSILANDDPERRAAQRATRTPARSRPGAAARSRLGAGRRRPRAVQPALHRLTT